MKVHGGAHPGARFTCFTGTKGQIRAQSVFVTYTASVFPLSLRGVLQFFSFPGTTLTILTLRMRRFVCLSLYANILTYADVC